MLFSEPLALLKYNLKHLELFTSDHTIMGDAYGLVTGSAGFFGAETSREAFLKLVLPKLLRGQNEWQRETSDKKAKSVGAWLEGTFSYLIVELKNERGLGGDPFLRGLVTYGKVIAQKEVLSRIVPNPTIAPPLSHIIQYVAYLQRSNFPAILLSFAGNRLVVSTAIFTDAVYAEALLSITLHLGPHRPDNVLQAARMFMAINESMGQLHQLYQDLLRAYSPSSQ